MANATWLWWFFLFGEKFEVDEKCNGKLRSAQTYLSRSSGQVAALVLVVIANLVVVVSSIFFFLTICCFCKLHSSCNSKSGNKK